MGGRFQLQARVLRQVNSAKTKTQQQTLLLKRQEAELRQMVDGGRGDSDLGEVMRLANQGLSVR